MTISFLGDNRKVVLQGSAMDVAEAQKSVEDILKMTDIELPSGVFSLAKPIISEIEKKNSVVIREETNRGSKGSNKGDSKDSNKRSRRRRRRGGSDKGPKDSDKKPKDSRESGKQKLQICGMNDESIQHAYEELSSLKIVKGTFDLDIEEKTLVLRNISKLRDFRRSCYSECNINRDTRQIIIRTVSQEYLDAAKWTIRDMLDSLKVIEKRLDFTSEKFQFLSHIKRSEVTLTFMFTIGFGIER